jgi:hypothetical protein
MERINLEKIDYHKLDKFPEEFILFAKKNNLKYPKINTGNGKALAVMLHNPGFYFDREMADNFVQHMALQTKDSIQLFNKHSQWGIMTNSDENVRGKNYIVYPYRLSNKHKMRKNFKFNGTQEQKDEEIEKIKKTIAADYVNVPNEKWQLGHKNPGSTDNSTSNLILQPPIQAKYRDNYVFIDTLTKMPMPKEFEKLHKSGDLPYTDEDLIKIRDYLNSVL